MFKKFFELWSSEDLVSQALNDTIDMLKLSREQFGMVIAPQFTGKQVDLDGIYKNDKEINKYEIEIRKKVMEHLTVSPNPDVSAALVLTTITVDIERLGDYSKNMAELPSLHGENLEGTEAFKRIEKLYDNVKEMYDLTIQAFSNSENEIASRIIDMHLENSSECEKLIKNLLKNSLNVEETTSNLDVIATLSARYLKRTSSHLKNIATSIVNPFDRIGFKPNSYKDF